VGYDQGPQVPDPRVQHIIALFLTVCNLLHIKVVTILHILFCSFFLKDPVWMPWLEAHERCWEVIWKAQKAANRQFSHMEPEFGMCVRVGGNGGKVGE
jgi:hypothetical protein